jgi:hypothetical protein
MDSTKPSKTSALIINKTQNWKEFKAVISSVTF